MPTRKTWILLIPLSLMAIWMLFFIEGEAPCVAAGLDITKAPEGALTLEQCIKVALENNPDIGARLGIVDAARAGVDEATGQRWPTLNAIGGYAHYLDPQRLVPGRRPFEAGAFSADILGGDLVMRLPVFTGFRITNEIKASEFLEESARQRLERTRQTLIFEVSQVFYFMLGQRKIIESGAFSKGVLEQHRKKVKHLIEAERAAKVDLLRTDVRIANVNQTLVQDRNILAIQHRMLGTLLGLKKNASPVTVEGELKLNLIDTNLDRSLKTAHQFRADYKAQVAETEAQKRRVDVARAGHWPTVSLEGSYGGRWAVGDTEKGPLASGSEDVGQAGIVLDIPIFEGGRISAGVRREMAKLRTAKEKLRNLELRIRLDVETALLNIRSNLERVHATHKAIEQGKESLRIEGEKYDMGRGSIIDVLDAQSSLLEAQTNYYRALAGYNTAIAQYHLAVGDKP